MAIFSSVMFSQDFIDRLRVPIIIKTKVAVGYDNNYLRLSNKEIESSNVSALGIVSTLDSPIIKPTLKFIYSPVIIDNHKTNVVSSISYSHFNQSINKSYFISNLSLELKLRSYSWIKLGIRDIPKYYLRNFHDRDISLIDYHECTFSSQKYFVSYSFPLQWIKKIWIKTYLEHVNEYYNSHFTEFDLKKTMVQLDLNHKIKKKHGIKISIAHGNANNFTHGSMLTSTLLDRSYVFEKIRLAFVYKYDKSNKIDKLGVSGFLEQRYYDLFSNDEIIDEWKFYLDGRVNFWIDWNIFDELGLKTWYQYRWRDADSETYGNFVWVEDVKSYSKHEVWLEFSFDFITDILY